MAKAFSELGEREILALAISLEEDDARIYGDYADRLKADYPDTAKMLKIMQDEELVHAKRLMNTCRAQFGEHIPFIQRHDVKGFLRRRPLWLAKVLGVQQVRKEVEVMEAESMRFYQTALRSMHRRGNSCRCHHHHETGEADRRDANTPSFSHG